MTNKWLKFETLFAAMLAKYGVSLSPTEDEMHAILTSIKDAHNDDIDNTNASQLEKNFAKLSNELFVQNLEQIYRNYKNK